MNCIKMVSGKTVNRDAKDKQTRIPLLNVDNPSAIKAVISKDDFSQRKLENQNLSSSPHASLVNKDEAQKLSNVQKQSDEESCADIEELGHNNDALKSKSIFQRFLGIFLAIGSSIMFSLNSLVVKLMPDANPFNICVWSFLFAGFFTLPFILFQSGFKKTTLIQDILLPFKKHYKTNTFIFLRSITSVGALVFLYFSMKYLDIGDANVIASSATIFVYFFSWVLLREDLDLVIIATGILAMTGVAVITRPPFLTGSSKMNMDFLIGTSLAFGCTVLVSISMIFVRFLTHVHYSLLTFILYIWGTVLSIIFAEASGVLAFPKCQMEWILMAVSGVLNVLAQILLSSALQCEQAGHVSLTRTSSIPFSFIWQFIFLGVIPDVLSFVGAFMIFTGIVITILRKLVNSEKKT